MSRANPSATNGCANNHPKPASYPEPAPGGRDGKGRFTRGNTSGTGNPFAATVAKLRKAALEVVTPQEIQGVFRVLLLKAQTGELASMKLLFAYTLGKPAAAVDPDEVDTEQPATKAEMPAVAVPERQEVAARLQDFIHQAASALPCDAWQALVSGFATIAGNVLHKANQSDSEDPQPCEPDVLAEEIHTEPREQTEATGSPAVMETASTEKHATTKSDQANEADRQANEQSREASPGNAPESGTTRHSQHSRSTQGQEATADDEGGKHPTNSDNPQTQGKCGSGETGQTKCAEHAMVIPPVQQGTVTNGGVQRPSVVE